MKIKYQEKIVAYLDVLGFSDLVYSQTEQPINRYFNFLLNNFRHAAGKYHLKYFFISDSIVVSAKFDKDNLKIMIRTLCKLQAMLLSEGILIRGAISFGDLYLNKSRNIMVGSGLINAYQLESYAVYPRIILDRRFIDQYYDGTVSLTKEMQDNSIDLLILNPPVPYLVDFPYINYTRFFGFSRSKHNYYNRLLKLFKNNYYQNKNIEKYEWLRRHISVSMNERFKYLKELTHPSDNTTSKKSRPIERFIANEKLKTIEWFIAKLQNL